MLDLNATAVAHENDTLTHSDNQDHALGEITYAVGDDTKSGAPGVSFNGGTDTIGGSIGTFTTVMDIELPFSSALELFSDIDVVGINTTLDTRFAYQILVSTTFSVLDLYGLLYSGSGSTISSVTASSGQDLVFDLASGQGIEHIAISDSSNDDVGDYTITINNDDTIASSIGGGVALTDVEATFTSEIDVIGDVDVIDIGSVLDARFAYQVALSTTANDFRLYGLLRDTSGTMQFSGIAPSDGMDLIFDLATGAGVQYIEVADA